LDCKYFKHNNEDATYQEKFVDVNFSILVDVNFTENLMKLVFGYFLSSFLSNISPYTIWFYEQYDYTGWAKKVRPQTHDHNSLIS